MLLKVFINSPELAGGKLVKTDASSNLTTGTIDHTNLTAGFLSTDNNLGGSSTSDIIISSQKAIKTYVDNAIAGPELEGFCACSYNCEYNTFRITNN